MEVLEARAVQSGGWSSWSTSTTFAEVSGEARGQGEVLLLQQCAGASGGGEVELPGGSRGATTAWSADLASTGAGRRRRR